MLAQKSGTTEAVYTHVVNNMNNISEIKLELREKTM